MVNTDWRTPGKHQVLPKGVIMTPHDAAMAAPCSLHVLREGTINHAHCTYSKEFMFL